MRIHHFSFDQIPQLSKTDRDYVTGHKALRPFYKFIPEIESFKDVIEARKQIPVNRKLLVDVLLKQHDLLPPSDSVRANILALKDRETFTITTAHQPCTARWTMVYHI